MVPNEEISLDEDELRRLLEQPVPEDDGDESEVGGGDPSDSDVIDPLEATMGSMVTAAGDTGSSSTALGQDTIDQLLAQAQGGESVSTPPPAPPEAPGSSPTAESAAAPAKEAPARAAPRSAGTSSQPKAPVTVQPVQFASLGTKSARQEKGPLSDLGILLDVPLHITVELGRAEMPVREILALGPGSVVELDRSAGEVLDVLVNGTLVAQGEVVVVDEQFGIRLTRVFSPRSGIFEGLEDD